MYGVLSTVVRQRTAEIELRMALGAAPAEIFKVVLGHGLLLSVLGVMAGLLVAWGVTRIIASILVGVSATDPFTFVAMTGLFLVIAAVASWLPARRATKVDPMVALRSAVRVKGFELTLLALNSSLVNAKWLITTVDLRSRPYELLSYIGQSPKSNVLCPQRLHRIKLRCLPRSDQARNHCNREQEHRGPHKGSGIKRHRAIQQRTNQPRGCRTGHQSENQPGQCRTQPVQQRSSRSGEEHQKSRLDVPDARLKRRDDVSPPTPVEDERLRGSFRLISWRAGRTRSPSHVVPGVSTSPASGMCSVYRTRLR